MGVRLREHDSGARRELVFVDAHCTPYGVVCVHGVHSIPSLLVPFGLSIRFYDAVNEHGSCSSFLPCLLYLPTPLKPYIDSSCREITFVALRLLLLTKTSNYTSFQLSLYTPPFVRFYIFSK